MRTPDEEARTTSALNMLCLAIILTELYFNCSIDTEVRYGTLRQYCEKTKWMVFADLKFWLERRHMDQAAAFPKAIHCCLTFATNPQFSTSKAEDVEQFLRHVVSPLQAELEDARRLQLPIGLAV